MTDRNQTIGLFSMNSGACAQPEVAARIAAVAEELGFDSLWAGEHVVLPSPQAPPSPMGPTDPILDPVVALTHLAARTERVRLGTGIIILPQRNPLVLAKELASLDVLSNGRLLFGVGVGYLQREFEAIGVPMQDRAPRSVEYLEAMQSLWYDEAPAYEGSYVRFANVDAYPRPVQRPIPVVMGGHTAPAYRRSVAMARGWYGFALGLEQTKACLDGLRAAADEVERPASLGDLEVSVTPRGRVGADEAEAYSRLGVHRLVLLPRPGLDAEATEAWVRDHAPGSLGATPA